MKSQITNRLSLPLIADVLEQFNSKGISAAQACGALGVGKSRLYLLRSEYLRRKARDLAWEPGVSGGDHAQEWPAEAGAFPGASLKAGYSYAFAASETGRLLGFETARSQVRHWALRRGLAKAPRPRPASPPTPAGGSGRASGSSGSSTPRPSAGPGRRSAPSRFST